MYGSPTTTCRQHKMPRTDGFAKDGILQCERPPFTLQKAINYNAFCGLSGLNMHFREIRTRKYIAKDVALRN